MTLKMVWSGLLHLSSLKTHKPMISISFENKEAVIRFPETLVSKDYIRDFIDYLRVEETAQKSKLTEEQLWEMTEHIQNAWWEKNKQKLIDKIESRRP